MTDYLGVYLSNLIGIDANCEFLWNFKNQIIEILAYRLYDENQQVVVHSMK